MSVFTKDLKPGRAPGLVGRFRRERKGSVAIEFAALAIPFSLLVFAIIESCVSFAGQQLLANATDGVARQVRTGQIRSVDLTEQKLKRMICDDISILVAAGCPDLIVDLRKFDTFAEAAAIRIRLTPQGDIDTTGFRVEAGQATTINMLRVFYRWPVMTDFMRRAMSTLPGGKTLHFATTTWQNEPFED